MLQKQPVDISFGQGIDTKTDSFRVSPGRFLSLTNSIFDKLGRLTKRNGFGSLMSLPDNSSTFLTTYNNNLLAIGTSINAYTPATAIWTDKGFIQPVELSTSTLVRNGNNQSFVDSASSPTGYTCTVYIDNVTDISGPYIKYVVSNTDTGQNITLPRVISGSPSAIPLSGGARVFLLGQHFIILYSGISGSTPPLLYIAVSINDPTIFTAPTQIVAAYTPSSRMAFDGVVFGPNLYIAYNTVTGGQSVKLTYLTQALSLVTPVTLTGAKATIMTMALDESTAHIYLTTLSASGGTHTYTFDSVLNQVYSPYTNPEIASTSVNITSTGNNGIASIYAEEAGTVQYDASIPYNVITASRVNVAAGSSMPSIQMFGVGLASKAFFYNGVSYYLTVYQSPYQSTYFLMADERGGVLLDGRVIAKLAYGNAGGYLAHGLPSAVLIDDTVTIPYLIKDLVQAVNKNTNVPTGSATAGIYTQTGINRVSVLMTTSALSTADVGQDLNVSGGFVWSYDGFQAVEQEFFLYPDFVEVTTSATDGFLSAQEYFYQVTYEWTDNQGNLFRSSPSIPVSITTSGSTSSNTINVLGLSLTYKITNPVNVVIYRWSVAQQVYYQITSVSEPLQNDTTIPFVTFVDTLADEDILGNNILYTTGGVLENIGPPATKIMALFNSRLFLVDSEDPNLLWYSKQIIEATPVEFSDLLTIYVAPTISAQGSTGPTTALGAMDDKLVAFKSNAIYYISGTGPDNTGANSQYTDPIFITAAAGCINQQSIVLTPNGLMFQSSKGIWILKRDLSTEYIGAPVEAFNSIRVQSAVSIPNTNQIRFTLENGIILMYDYYVGQWNTFTGVANGLGMSSTLYQNEHTVLNSLGQVFQETPGVYLDGSSPVLMSAQTGWISLAGVQGYERFYEMLLLGTYISPFKLDVRIAYDFEQNSARQSTIVTPKNKPLTYGSDSLYGGSSPYGGESRVFKARVFPTKQKCESFQISFQEIYDTAYLHTAGGTAGEGLTLTGMQLSVGVKKGSRPSSAGRSFG